MSERKIDIYNHVMPRAVADRIRELAPGRGDMVKRETSIPSGRPISRCSLSPIHTTPS
jgi:hypothetical protein